MTSDPDYDDYEDDLENEAPTSIVEWVWFGVSYVWFHRRMLIGFALTCGLAYGVYKVYIIPPKTFEDESSLVLNGDSNVLSNLPSATIDFQPVLDTPEVETVEKPKIRTMDDIPLPEKKVVASYDPILDGGSVEDMIEETLHLGEAWVSKTPPVKFLMNQRRAKITRKLMGLPLTQSQQTFALSDYIESLVILDNLVAEKQYNTPQVRAAVNEIVAKYSDHPHPVISAKANLASVLLPVHNFIREDKDELLVEFTNLLPGRIDMIVQDLPATHRLAGMTYLVHQRRNWDGSVLPYCMEVVRRLEAMPEKEVRKLGTTLREKLYFDHLEPAQMVDRILLNDAESRRNVQKFFEALDANPNIKIEYYQIAVSAIQVFKERDEKEDYNALIDWLRRIGSRVKTETIRNKIFAVIKELDELPFGKPAPAEAEE